MDNAHAQAKRIAAVAKEVLEEIANDQGKRPGRQNGNPNNVVPIGRKKATSAKERTEAAQADARAEELNATPKAEPPKVRRNSYYPCLIVALFSDNKAMNRSARKTVSALLGKNNPVQEVFITTVNEPSRNTPLVSASIRTHVNGRTVTVWCRAVFFRSSKDLHDSGFGGVRNCHVRPQRFK